MNKVKNLKRLKLLCNISANIMMVCQIIFIILLLLCSVYGFLLLFDNHSLDFMAPVVEYAKGLIRFLFGENIKSSQAKIDGELILFIILDGIIVFVFSQLKTAFQRCTEQLDKKIVEEKAKEEVQFNKDLQSDLQRNISSYNHFMLGFAFTVSPYSADALQIYGVEKLDVPKIEEEVILKFYNAAKALPNVKVSREDKILLITSSHFDGIDSVIDAVQAIIIQLKKEYRMQRVALKTKLAIDAYKSMTPLKKVYELVKPLLDLNLSSGILCYGNFKNRYDLIKDSKYAVYVKGKYDIAHTEETIWAMVKKD